MQVCSICSMQSVPPGACFARRGGESGEGLWAQIGMIFFYLESQQHSEVY